MAQFKVGVIGCGGRGKAHAEGYQASADVKMVACADPMDEGRAAFMEEFGVEKGYADYQEMLDKEDLDIVSICTWTGMHKDMVVAAASSGIAAIHCEKPMATNWGDSKELYQACVDNDVVITFCHQRRFAANYAKARQLAHDGTIGQLVRVEGACPNLFDWGTHWYDMFCFYNNEAAAEWVMGQIDVEAENKVFDALVETSGLAWIHFKSGVDGLLATGGVSFGDGTRNRLIGTEGMIEVGGGEEPPLRFKGKGDADWVEPDLQDVVPPGGDSLLATLDLIDALKNGREPELSGRKALQATELIFATYESSRRRAKIHLPLDVDDSALVTMVEERLIGPRRI